MTADDRVRTGIPGLDPILGGGLPANALYLLKGAPGTGKTTFGLQYLVEGARRGETCLYLGLSETRGQLTAIARSYGWSLDGIEIHEMRRRGGAEETRTAYTVFSPSEVELDEITREINEQVNRVQPARLVLDSLSEIRLLSDDPFRYRRELLVLSDRITGRKCTGWLIDVETEGNEGVVAETLVSGLIHLQQFSPSVRRRAPAPPGAQAASVTERGRLPRLRDRRWRPRGLPASGRRVAPQRSLQRRSAERDPRASMRCSVAGSIAARARCSWELRARAS